MNCTFDRLAVTVGGLHLSTPLIVASGIWPYEDQLWQPELLNGLGAVCSKAITLEPRPGNKGERIWETPSGMLNSIGLQNEGAASFFKNRLARLKSHGKPVLLNLCMESAADLQGILDVMEPCTDLVDAVELNVSCPNVDQGCMSWGVDAALTQQATEQVRSLWKGPLWVKLTPQAPDPVAVARGAEAGGADAIVVANTWLGTAIDVTRSKPVFDRVVAGLSGPAIFPLALRMVWQVSSVLSIPVVGCGGIQKTDDVLAMFMAGASAVEIGMPLFHDLETPRKICQGLLAEMERRNFHSMSCFTGLAQKTPS